MKEGVPVNYQWTPPSLIPSVLPWLAVLLLLLVKSNRCGQVWWIWAPLGCVAVFEQLSRSAFGFLSSGGADIFLDLAGSLAFGVAAVWLLAPQLARSQRVLTFLCYAPTLAGFSLFSFLAIQDWNGDGAIMALGMLVPLALSIFVISLAMTLAGLACRSRYRPPRYYLWLLASLFVAWLVVVAPFFVFAVIVSGGLLAWSEFFTAILVLTAVSFGLLLPFLVLASANSLFRERFQRLLIAGRETPPPVLPPALAPLAGAAPGKNV